MKPQILMLQEAPKPITSSLPSPFITEVLSVRNRLLWQHEVFQRDSSVAQALCTNLHALLDQALAQGKVRRCVHRIYRDNAVIPKIEDTGFPSGLELTAYHDLIKIRIQPSNLELYVVLV